jgi:phosphoenolpyruvate-protein kinase (PTS system EI component)
VDSTLVGSILQSAGAGTAIIVVLILLGIISPRSYVTRVEAEADKWYKAWEASRTEVEELRRTLAVQAERTDNAIAAAQRSTETLERFQMRMPNVVEAQAQAHPRRRGAGDSGG